MDQGFNDAVINHHHLMNPFEASGIYNAVWVSRGDINLIGEHLFSLSQARSQPTAERDCRPANAKVITINKACRREGLLNTVRR